MNFIKTFFSKYNNVVSDDDLFKGKNQIINGYKKFYNSHIDDCKDPNRK